MIPTYSGLKISEIHECIEAYLDSDERTAAAENTFQPEFLAGMSASESLAVRLTIGKIFLEIANHAVAYTIANTISVHTVLGELSSVSKIVFITRLYT